MSILSDFEDRLARTVEGMFAGAFRSPVQPAELAKTLAKAMDDSRLVGVGKVYVPVEYTVTLSEADSKELGTIAETLAGELETYLIAYAQEEGYHLTSHPKVRIETSGDLKLGRFMVHADAQTIGPSDGDLVPDEERISSPTPASRRKARGHLNTLSTVTVSGISHDVALKGDRVLVGRLADCDICLDDANASRNHAVFVHHADGWWIEDMGSTNGTLVNDQPIERCRLQDGDVIQVGVTRLVYHEPKG